MIELSDKEIECPVHSQALQGPDQIAIRAGDLTLSYLELDRKIDRVAIQLSRLGVEANSRVALHLEHTWPYIVVLWALFRRKAIAIPLNNRDPVGTIPDRLDQVDCGHLISREDGIRVTKEGPLDVFTLATVMNPVQGKPGGSECVVQYSQPATLLFSSGSTGTPKAILHVWGNHYFNAAGSNANIALEPGDSWLLALPLYHVSGIAILFRCFIAGATVVIPGKGEAIGESVTRFGISHASLVGTQLKRLLDTRVDRFSTLKAVLVGGSKIPRSFIDRSLNAGLPIHTTYGLTEMASQVTTTPPGADRNQCLTSGRLLPHRELTLSSDGEILVKGKTRCAGYWSDGGVALPFDDEGWFHTGDIGYLNEEGYLSVVGRKDNMFISGGENIYPEEIEKQLEVHPEVERAVVVPVDDGEFGNRPVAFIEPAAGASIEQKMNAHLEGKLARYMFPIAYLFVKDVPQKGGLKLDRRDFIQYAKKVLGSG